MIQCAKFFGTATHPLFVLSKRTSRRTVAFVSTYRSHCSSAIYIPNPETLVAQVNVNKE